MIGFLNKPIYVLLILEQSTENISAFAIKIISAN